MPLVEKLLAFLKKKNVNVWVCVHVTLKAGRGLCFAAEVGDICGFPDKGLGL